MADSCPSCGHVPVESDRCPACGRISPLYRKALETMRRGPQRIPSPPTRRASLGGGDGRTLRFHGDGGTLFGIHVVNVFLTLVTLGVYRFWAKTRVRRYLMSQTEFDGDRFAWHGTGRELLVGFAKAMLVFGLPIAGLNTFAMLQPDGWTAVAAQILGYLILFVFVPVAMVGVHRYRLSRTSWRGIRFSFRGRVRDFVGRFLIDAVCMGLTVGLYYPVFQVRRYAFMVSHACFGQRRFTFDGRARDLVGPFLFGLLFTIPTLGFVWFWYAARKRRYLAGHTAFDVARFRATVTGRELMNLTLANALLLVVTLGLAWPWTRVRTSRFNYARLHLEGTLDLGSILQEPQAAPATGDALAGFLGADIDLA